jgi:hypothetical protein
MVAIELHEIGAMVDAWHDVFVVLGTTAAALVGLVFVAVSVGVTVKQPRKGLAEFTGQTVINFTLALVACLIALSPADPKISGAVLLAPATLGLGYALWFWQQMQLIEGYEPVKTDWLFYGLLPVVDYILLIIAAVMLIAIAGSVTGMLVAALALLVVSCIRNSYDLTIWASMQ